MARISGRRPHLISRGANYGWSVYEGSHPFYLERKRGPTPLVLPTIEHPHSEFRSLTGGVVYRGERFPELDGAYIYGDYSSGRIWGMKHDGKRVIWHRELADTSLQITAFRVDHRGELLIADYGGGIDRLVPMPKAERHRAVPNPAEPDRPVSIDQHAPGRSRAHSLFCERTGAGPITLALNNSWLCQARRQSDSIPVAAGVSPTALPWFKPSRSSTSPATRPRGSASRHGCSLRQQGEWAGFSYRWNAAQTDATLVAKNGEDAEFAVSGRQATANAARADVALPQPGRVHGLPQPRRQFRARPDGLAGESRTRVQQSARQPAPSA